MLKVLRGSPVALGAHFKTRGIQGLPTLKSHSSPHTVVLPTWGSLLGTLHPPIVTPHRTPHTYLYLFNPKLGCIPSPAQRLA